MFKHKSSQLVHPKQHMNRFNTVALKQSHEQTVLLSLCIEADGDDFLDNGYVVSPLLMFFYVYYSQSGHNLININIGCLNSIQL